MSAQNSTYVPTQTYTEPKTTQWGKNGRKKVNINTVSVSILHKQLEISHAKMLIQICIMSFLHCMSTQILYMGSLHLWSCCPPTQLPVCFKIDGFTGCCQSCDALLYTIWFLLIGQNKCFGIKGQFWGSICPSFDKSVIDKSHTLPWSCNLIKASRIVFM